MLYTTYMNIYLWNHARKLSLYHQDEMSSYFQCVHEDHPPLETGLDYDLRIYVYCLECQHRKYVGMKTYAKLLALEHVS